MSRIFISYSRADSPFVEQLHKNLEEMSFDVWLDKADLFGGDDWWSSILAAIADSDIFIYVLSNESIASAYCQAEFQEAKRLQKAIITILARSRTVLPPELSSIQHIDMSKGANEFEAIKRLNASILRLSKSSTSKAPLSPVVTPQPKADNSSKQAMKLDSTQLLVAVISLVGVILAALIGVMPQLWGRWDIEASQTAIALAPTRTELPPSPTSEPTNTDIPPSPTSEPSATDIPPSPTTAPTDTDIPPSPSDAPVEANSLSAPTTAPTNTHIPPSPTSSQINQSYPCDGTVVNPNGSANVINVVYAEASESSTRGASIRVGNVLTIQRLSNVAGHDWYLLYNGSQRLGWALSDYIIPSESCP